MFLTFPEYAAYCQQAHILSNNPELVLKKQGVLLSTLHVKNNPYLNAGISESSLFVSCNRVALIQVNIHLLSLTTSFSYKIN